VIPPALIQEVKARFALDWRGIQGAVHWARVPLISVRLAERTGVRRQVVELFAFLHDSYR
jgi:HD superfamily phosphodiesterase